MRRQPFALILFLILSAALILSSCGDVSASANPATQSNDLSYATCPSIPAEE